MKWLIIGDPLETLLPATDTGLSLLREAHSRGRDVHWATPGGVILNGVSIEVSTQFVTESIPGALPKTKIEKKPSKIDDFDCVWIRKDPPVDMNYISLCWLLAHAENSTVILNPPSLLLRFHEKMIPYEAHRAGYLNEDEVVPTSLWTGESSPTPATDGENAWISKPWLGHGGRDISKWDSIDHFLKALENFQNIHTDPLMLQAYYPAIKKTGDRRVLFIGGKYVGDFVRFPAGDSLEANLSRGGRAAQVEMTASEKETTSRLGDYLKSIKIALAGADFIDGRVTEVNITAPTGFETLRQLQGIDLGAQLVDFTEKLVAGKVRWQEE